MELDGSKQGAKRKPGRKPGQRRRTSREVARDNREIARLRLRYKYSLEEIADSLNSRFYSAPGETAHVGTKQVDAVLTELTKKAVEETAQDIKTLRALSIKELEDNERFCLEKFEESERSKTKRGTKRRQVLVKGKTLEGDETKKPGTLTEVNIERQHRDGDSSWIGLYYKFRNRRYELLGIDPPKKIAPTNPTGDKPFEFEGTEEMRRLVPLFNKFLTAQKGDK